MNMKQKKKRKKSNVWHYIGGIAFVASMCVIMPKVIGKFSDYLYGRKHFPVKPQDEEDWGPEIVKKNTLEDTEDGEI